MRPIERSWLAAGLVPILLLAAGCDDVPELPLKSVEPPALFIGSQFNPQTAGTVSGQVLWTGTTPEVKPFEAPLSTGTEGLDRALGRWPNPHTPVVDAQTRGVGGAVIFLRGVEPNNARPWDYTGVRVEMRGGQFHVHQDGNDTWMGFVRPGDAVELTSQEKWFEILQARGAAFFSIAFADPGRVRKRRLDRLGHVEFISGAGHYWMRAHIIVVDHPYFTRTDSAGQFTLPQVPPGDYELVCWHPNWLVASHERDVGTLFLTHVAFRPAVERARPIHVGPGGNVNATFALSTADFER